MEATSIPIGLLLVDIVRFSTEVAMACMHSSGLAHTTTALTEIGALAPASMLRQALPKSRDINTSWHNIKRDTTPFVEVYEVAKRRSRWVFHTQEQ